MIAVLLALAFASDQPWKDEPRYGLLYLQAGGALVDANDLFFPGTRPGWVAGAGMAWFQNALPWLAPRAEFFLQGYAPPAAASDFALARGFDKPKAPIDIGGGVGLMLDPEEVGGPFVELAARYSGPMDGRWRPYNHFEHVDFLWGAGWRTMEPVYFEVGLRADATGAGPGEQATLLNLYVCFGAALEAD